MAVKRCFVLTKVLTFSKFVMKNRTQHSILNKEAVSSHVF